MERSESIKQFSRRGFLGCISGLLAAAGLEAAGQSVLDKPPEKGLYDPLTPEEETVVNASEMAKEMVKLPGQGFNCAESIFLAGLKYLKKPGDYVQAAAAFGGGMGHFDLCGLLTGGFMALGVAAATYYSDRKKMKAQARMMSKEYWKWWESWAPIHCYQLRTKYDKAGYKNMARRVAAKVEELIKECEKNKEKG